MFRHELQTGWLIFAPGWNSTVIGLPELPDPCTDNVEVIVPQTPTVVPGAIALPTPQFDAVLKNVTPFAFAQLLPSPVPAADCATYTPAPPPTGHADVEALTDATPDTFPAPSTAATPSV